MEALRQHVPARVPEPHRRDRHLPQPGPRADPAASWRSSCGDLRKRLAERKITLELTEAAQKTLAEHGYDPVFGARPLKRAIQRMVENPLALEILAGNIREGDHVVVDTRDRETFNFRKEERVPQPA